MKTPSFIQLLIFLGVLGLFVNVMIFNPPIALTGVGALIIFLSAIVVGSWWFWAIGNKGNPNYAQIEPSSAGWRMLFYMIMLAYVVIYELVAFLLAGHNPLAGIALNSLTSEQVLLFALPGAMLVEWFERG